MTEISVIKILFATATMQQKKTETLNENWCTQYLKFSSGLL